MMKFMKCEMCGVEVAKEEKCEFANYIRNIDGKEVLFCCAKCADEYKKKHRTGRRTRT